MKNRLFKVLLVAIGLLGTTGSGWGASQLWDGGATTPIWDTKKNWLSQKVPGPADDVTFGSGFASGLSIDLAGPPPLTANSLTIDTITGFSLNNNTLTLTSGNLTRNDVAGTEADQQINSSVVLGGPGVLNINGSGTLLMADVTASHGFVKSGGGTLKLGGIVTSSSILSEAITINAGTLLLGAANRISDNSPIRLAGGTFATGGFSETVGALTLTASSQINLGAGSSSLVFSSSSGVAWTAGAMLTIQNWSGSATDRVYVGSSSGGLNTGQVSQIRFDSPQGLVGFYNAQILGSGEIVPLIVPIPEPATLVGAAMLGLFVSFRERKMSSCQSQPEHGCGQALDL